MTDKRLTSKIMKKMKTISLWTLSFILLVSGQTGPAYGAYDNSILTQPVSNIYEAGNTGEAITNNMNFTDLSSSHWAKEAVTQLGALGVVKGYNEGNILSYRPDEDVSNEEALAFLLRVIGQEDAAITAATNLAANPGDPLLTIWSRGYLQIANNLGLITGAQLGDALILDQTLLDPTVNFMRSDPVTREQIAMWVVDAITAVNPGQIAPINVHQAIFNLSDWENIGLDYVPYVEAVMQAGIMVGDGSNFNPAEPLSRAEMAQIILNINDILYNTMGVTYKSGIVGAIVDEATITGTTSSQVRRIYVRNQDGEVDQMNLTYNINSLNQVASLDAPVLTSEGVKGLSALKEGDQIHYVVDDTASVVRYVSVQTPSSQSIRGTLMPLDKINTGTITITDDQGMVYNYGLSSSIYDLAGSTITIDGLPYPISQAPVGYPVRLMVENQMVTEINNLGSYVLSNEVSGIIKEVDTDFGFITIQDWEGNEVTKYYNPDTVVVEKENYYDTEDEVGYLDELFPNYEFDERDSQVSALEAGDIVHMLLDSTNLAYTTRISAKTNYSVKFGRVGDLTDMGALGTTMRLYYSDGTIGTMTVPSDVAVMLGTKNVGADGLKTGQMVKVLLNQAVLEPGRTTSSVKQVDIDPYGNVAGNIYKGELGPYDAAKDTLKLLNTYTLAKSGWVDYTQLVSLPLSDEGVEIYYNGHQISLGYANRYLQTEPMTTYVVTQDRYGDESIAKIIFEEGRGDVLDSTNIAYSNGYDTIRLINSSDDIAVDAGTIVIKDGHLVANTSIMTPDYAQVVLSDAGHAVVVNVTPEPGNDGISVFRGRIDSIEEGLSFAVESNAVLKDMEWVYSPIARQFTLNYDTRIITEDGRTPLSEFVDYTQLSKVDEVYTIIADGTDALYLVKNVYPTEGVIGTVYNTDADNIYINDVLVYTSDDKAWNDLSYTNSYAQIGVATESIILKNNEVVSMTDLEVGDKIRAMVTVDLAEELKLNNNRLTTGYIIYVED